MARDLLSSINSLKLEIKSKYQSELVQLDFDSPLVTIAQALSSVKDNSELLKYWSMIFLLACEKSKNCIPILSAKHFVAYLDWAITGVLYEINECLTQSSAKCIDTILVNEFIESLDQCELNTSFELFEIVKKYENYFAGFDFKFKQLVNISVATLWDSLRRITEQEEPEDQIKVLLDQLLTAHKLGLHIKDLSYALAESVFKCIRKSNSDKLDDQTWMHNRESIQIAMELIQMLEAITEEADILQKIDGFKKQLNVISQLEPTSKHKVKETKNEEEEIKSHSIAEKESFMLNPDILLFDKSSIMIQNMPIYNMSKGKVNISINEGQYQGKQVCVKVYSVSCREDIKEIERSINEIKIYEQLSKISDNSNCFLKYYGTFFGENSVNMVMEWFGENLMERIYSLKINKSKLVETMFVKILYSMLNSYKIMADKGILHNDIKPHNMLVDNEFNIKLIDFDVSLIKVEDSALSKKGFHIIQGTDGYLSPEKKSAWTALERSAVFNPEKADVYSLGVVFYQLLTFQNVNNKTSEEMIKEIHDFPGYSSETKNVLAAMLTENPKYRPLFSETLSLLTCIPATLSYVN